MEKSVRVLNGDMTGGARPRSRTLSTTCNLQPPKNIRAVVLGKDGVGKSAFTVRLLTRRFIGEYDSSLESTYQHRFDVDGQLVDLEILDTAGKNSLEKMDVCSKADLFYILYSTTESASFQEATLLTKYLTKTKNVPSSKMVLIATKKDLKHMINVTEYEGRLLALDLGCLFYYISNREGFSQDVLLEPLRKVVISVTARAPRSPLMKLKRGLMHLQKSRSYSFEL